MDTIYYANTIDANGELRLVRVTYHAEVEIPRRVPVVISEPVNSDPTVAVFHDKLPDTHNGYASEDDKQ